MFDANHSPASRIDHTLLKPDATAREILLLCEEAAEMGFASVCVPPIHVPLASKTLYGSGVAVGTVVGFPLGYEMTRVKAYQTFAAIEAGAGEIDMVINLGSAREQRYDDVSSEVREVVAAADQNVVKVIIETCLFKTIEKRRLVEAVMAGGADFVKTSTGFAAFGATVEDVALLHETAAGAIGVKASGGIRDWSTCYAMLCAGASRIGSSSGVAIMAEWQRGMGLSP